MSSLGLQRGKVKLVEFDPTWPELFEQEKRLLLETLGDRIMAIEHIGSTSIPGLAAKPIIDMVAGIRSLDEADSFINILEKMGYEYMPERQFVDRHFFPKGPREHRTHHLSLVEYNKDAWIMPIRFRDYLLTHKQAREEYALIKKKLAEKLPDDRYEYTARKDAFIKKVLEKIK